MNFGRTILFITLLAFLTMSLLGEDYRISDPFLDERVIEIQALHDKAVTGDKATTDLLIAKIQSQIEQDPENQLYHVYLGSAYTLKSWNVFPGPSKLRYLKDGLKGMDAAVKKDPKNPSVRFIRAVNNYHLPAFINRKDNARKDFEILLKQIKADPGKLDARTIQAIHYFAGLAFKQTKRDDDARSTWQSGIALQSDTALTKKMQQELAKL